MLINTQGDVIGIAYDDDGLAAFSRYPQIRRAVRFLRTTTDAQEENWVGANALNELDLFSKGKDGGS